MSSATTPERCHPSATTCSLALALGGTCVSFPEQARSHHLSPLMGRSQQGFSISALARSHIRRTKTCGEQGTFLILLIKKMKALGQGALPQFPTPVDIFNIHCQKPQLTRLWICPSEHLLSGLHPGGLGQRKQGWESKCSSERTPHGAWERAKEASAASEGCTSPS